MFRIAKVETSIVSSMEELTTRMRSWCKKLSKSSVNRTGLNDVQATLDSDDEAQSRKASTGASSRSSTSSSTRTGNSGAQRKRTAPAATGSRDAKVRSNIRRKQSRDVKKFGLQRMEESDEDEEMDGEGDEE